MAIKLSNAVARLACDSVVDAVDVGVPVSKLIIYNGTKPANLAEAIAAQTALLSFDLPDPCFAGAADNLAGGARATANAVTPATVSTTGIAQFFRVFDGDSIPVMDGVVTNQVGTGDLKLSDVNLQTGIQVQVFSWTVTMPEG